MQLGRFKAALLKTNIDFLENENMSLHTTFKIGGAADVFINVKSSEELESSLKLAKENGVPYLILGKGSNLLISDLGIEGAVISTKLLDNIKIDGTRIICESGAHLSKLCTKALNSGLTGLEFAYGIPGSVGGALYMNAGAYGGEMSQVVVGAYCLNENSEREYIALKDMELGYRTSIFKKNNAVITEIVFELKTGDKDLIKQKMDELMQKRIDKQPLDFASAGSTFKRPPDNFAGTLIEKNNLKGVNFGDAVVSEKHAGFVINKGSASAKDVLDLIEHIKQTVYKNDGVILEPEVIFKGRKQ